jgi:hypothetical protein
MAYHRRARIALIEPLRRLTIRVEWTTWKRSVHAKPIVWAGGNRGESPRCLFFVAGNLHGAEIANGCDS